MKKSPAIGQMGKNDRGDRDQRRAVKGTHVSIYCDVPRRIFLAALITISGAGPITAQEIPPYVPANPVLASRSALYAQPFILPRSGWDVRLVSDYYNAVETSLTPPPARQYIFDAEVLQFDTWVTHDIGSHAFVIGDLPIRGAYDGFLDSFLNWYHGVIGLAVPARNELPIDHFEWKAVLADTTLNRQRPGTFLGDARIGAGWRMGNLEAIATATLPTATITADGWSRKTVGTSVALSGEIVRTARLALDAEATGGYTPGTHDLLGKYQRSWFGGGLAAMRWRFAGRQAVFATAWYQTGNWKNTGFAAMDNPEFSLDFGFLLRPARRGPELQLGMTQDLDPRGPAMDVGFTIGLRWASANR